MRTIKREIVGAFIFSSDGLLLMGKSLNGGVYPGCWIVPGGGIDPGETKRNALIREIKEETGLDISGCEIVQIDGVLTGKTEKTLRDSGETVMADMKFYNFKVVLPLKSAEVPIIAEDDFVDPAWFDKTEIKKLKLSPPSVTTLRKINLLR